MPPLVQSRWRRRVASLLLLASLAPAGCGLSDYEKKMHEAEARLQRFDELDHVLGDPLSLPTDPKPPMDVFLRPPKGVAKAPGAQPGDLPYHYSAASSAVCTDLYLIFGEPDADKAKLEKQVEGLFSAAAGWQSHEVRPTNRPAVVFDAADMTDLKAPITAPAVYAAYVHQTPGRPAVAVVFHVLQANRAAADDAFQTSLQTYREAEEASRALADWIQWRGR